MKKTGLLLVLCAALAASAQQNTSGDQTGTNPIVTAASFPFERVQTPTDADLYCAGFISEHVLPDANYVAGGLHTPIASKFQNGDLIYLTGGSYQAGQQYSILRELRDPNEQELFQGQGRLLKMLGQPYSELGRVRILDTRSKMAVAQVDFSCDSMVPGDIVVPFAEKTPISFHSPVRFDRYLPASNKTSGRIVMAKDFDSEIGTGGKVYLNVGSNQGVKVGDYFRATRSYEADLKDPVDSLSFKASESEDTEKNQAAFEPNLLTRTKGPSIHVADMPRRAVGEIVVLSTGPSTSTGMIVFSLEDVHVGDDVELDEQ
ncbi:MAG TPA: hypothetical protein VMH85_06385 [Terriglobales bacterium]|nr:hypothetical protein [Terriglobales bacterium]